MLEFLFFFFFVLPTLVCLPLSLSTTLSTVCAYSSPPSVTLTLLGLEDFIIFVVPHVPQHLHGFSGCNGWFQILSRLKLSCLSCQRWISSCLRIDKALSLCFEVRKKKLKHYTSFYFLKEHNHFMLWNPATEGSIISSSFWTVTYRDKTRHQTVAEMQGTLSDRSF